MSRRLLAALVVAALVVAGIAAAVVVWQRDSGPEGFAGAASSLCDDALAKIDRLGDPSEEGLDVVRERVEIGEQLVEDLDALAPDEGQEQQDAALVFAYRSYFRALRLGYEALRANQGSALKALDAAARKSLDEAVAAAEAVGATGCAARPEGS